jgi:hypothetical protein
LVTHTSPSIRWGFSFSRTAACLPFRAKNYVKVTGIIMRNFASDIKSKGKCAVEKICLKRVQEIWLTVLKSNNPGGSYIVLAIGPKPL